MHVRISRCYKLLTIFESGVFQKLPVCLDFFGSGNRCILLKTSTSGSCYHFLRRNLEQRSRCMSGFGKHTVLQKKVPVSLVVVAILAQIFADR